MHSITIDHFFSAFFMTVGMTLLIILVVGSVVYGLYRFFREETSERTDRDGTDK